MSKTNLPVPADFPRLLKEIKARIQQAQTRAVLAANTELVRLYWDVGQLLDARQSQEGWGAAVIPRLSRELQNELPEIKGFSERNIDRMVAFYRAYPRPADFSPQAVAKLKTPSKVPQAVAKSEQGADSLLWSIPWGHHALLLEKVKDLDQRLWYMQQTLANGWSRNILFAMIQSEAHARQGQAITNFERLLPSPQSDLVQQTLKDPYIFLKLRCFVVIDLKKGEFKPEYAGKVNFYLSIVDDQLRHDADAPSIGLILCQDRNHIVAEYALRGMNKPIGISEYELTRALPVSLRSALPTVEEIEAELADSVSEQPPEQSTLPAPTKRKIAKTSKPAKKKQSKKGRKP